MARAVETLSLDHVMSVTDTRVALLTDGGVESFAQKMKRPMPPLEMGLDAVSLWEDQISDLIITHTFRDLVPDKDGIQRYVGSYQAAQSIESLDELEAQWKTVFNKKVCYLLACLYACCCSIFKDLFFWHLFIYLFVSNVCMYRNFRCCLKSCCPGQHCVSGFAA